MKKNQKIKPGSDPSGRTWRAAPLQNVTYFTFRYYLRRKVVYYIKNRYYLILNLQLKLIKKQILFGVF
jgi:hypothetical protein